MDLLAKFTELAGATLPTDRVIDGLDIWPLMAGRPGSRSPHEAIYDYAYVHLQAVRGVRWKLGLPRPARSKWTGWSARMIDAVSEVQLYDLKNDRGETQDVVAEHPEIVARLKDLTERGREDIGDYNRIGSGARFFDNGEKRSESRAWLTVEKD